MIYIYFLFNVIAAIFIIFFQIKICYRFRQLIWFAEIVFKFKILEMFLFAIVKFSKFIFILK